MAGRRDYTEEVGNDESDCDIGLGALFRQNPAAATLLKSCLWERLTAALSKTRFVVNGHPQLQGRWSNGRMTLTQQGAAACHGCQGEACPGRRGEHTLDMTFSKSRFQSDGGRQRRLRRVLRSIELHFPASSILPGCAARGAFGRQGDYLFRLLQRGCIQERTLRCLCIRSICARICQHSHPVSENTGRNPTTVSQILGEYKGKGVYCDINMGAIRRGN